MAVPTLLPYGLETGVEYQAYGNYVAGVGYSVGVFNDSTDPNYIGPITDITGLDSPEIIESATNRVEDTGGVHGNFFYGRRPWTIAGKIIPSSTTDRNNKQTLLNNAFNNTITDGYLYWTPSGGESLQIAYRRQQPIRMEGTFAKDFFIGCVSADPRIYSTNVNHVYLPMYAAGGPDWERATFSAGTDHNVLGYAATLTANKTYRVRQWVKLDSGWNGGTVKIDWSNTSGTAPTTTNVTSYNTGALNTWQMLECTVATTAANVGYFRVNDVTSPTATHWVEAFPPQLQVDSITQTIGTGTNAFAHTAGTSYTYTNVTANQPNWNAFNQGNFGALPLARIYGPVAGVSFVCFDGSAGTSGSVIGTLTISGLSLTVNHYIDVNFQDRTVYDDAGTNLYSKVAFPGGWFELPSGPSFIAVAFVSGQTANTGVRFTYRNAYI